MTIHRSWFIIKEIMSTSEESAANVAKHPGGDY